MSISDNQKIDFLWKKLGYGATKTDINSIKTATNEAIASPLLLDGNNLWTDAYQIPNILPSLSIGIIEIYDDSGNGSSSIEAVKDTTATPNRTWKTNLTNWIPPQFGSTYAVKVYIAPSGTTDPQTSGTRIFAAGSGNNDEFFFDYQSGVLNFIGDNLPAGLDGNEIFIVGARYIGKLGNRFTALYADSADIGHAYIDSADIIMADIITAYIDSADILHAIIDSADITLARITNAEIDSAYIRYADIDHTDIDSADITLARINYADIDSSDVDLTRIITAYIDSADIKHAYIDSAQIDILNITGQINGPQIFVIDPAAVGDNTGKVIIKGDLQVDGTETIVNSTTVTVNDKNIVLADSAQDSSQADGAGITVFAANAKITYEATPDRWVFNKDIDVPAIYADSGIITDLTSIYADITRATIDSAGIEYADIDSADINLARISGLTVDSAHIKGNLSVGGDLTVSGNATIKSATGGNIYLGDSNEDNIVFSGDINSHLIPNTSLAFDIGSSDQRWRNIYLSGIQADSITTNKLTSNYANIDSADINVLRSGNLTVSGSGIITPYLDADSADISVLRIDSGNFKHFYADSAKIAAITIDSATIGNLHITGKLTGAFGNFKPNTVAIIDNNGTLTSDSSLSFDLSNGQVTVEKDLVARDVKLTSLYPGYILTSGDNDSIGFTEGLKYGNHVSSIITNDGFATSFQKLYDSGYYRFNVDDNTGKIIATGDIQLGRFTTAQFGTYYAPSTWTLPSNISAPRDFYGLEIFTDSAKLVSTAHENIFKSSLAKNAPNSDSFNVIEVLARYDSTLFEVRKDGSINFTGNIYKDGSIFTGGGIFIKNEPTADAAYNIPLSDITDPYAISLQSYGRVAIGTDTPKYKLDVIGDISVRGQIDSTGIVYALNTLAGPMASYMDDSNGSRFTYITSKGATRGGYFRGGPSGDYIQGNIGLFSTAFGEATRAKGLASLAIGSLTEAEADYSIALGRRTKTRANNTGTILIGTDVTVDSSVPIGSTQFAIGIGKENHLYGTSVIGIGTENNVNGNLAGVFGYNNTIGTTASATAASGSYAIGTYNTITGGGAYAVGSANILKGSPSYAFGDNNFIDANLGVALGTDIRIHGDNATGIGRNIRIDSSADNAIGINLSNVPMKVGSERILSINYGNVIIGDSGDKFNNYDGNLYVKGNIILAGELLQEGAPGVYQSTTPFVDEGEAVRYAVVDSTNVPKPLGINKIATYDLDILAQEGFAVSGITDGTFTVTDAQLMDSIPFIAGDVNLLTYQPKLELFRVGRFSDFDNQLSNEKLGFGSIALGRNNAVSGLYSTAIGNENNISRGGDLSFTSLKGSYTTFIGTNNILDSIATGSNNFILGEDNLIKGNTTNTFIIGRNVTANNKSDHIILNTSAANDSSLDNTKVAIGKNNADYALDVAGSIRVDSGATIYFGPKTIQDYLGFGSTTSVGPGFGTGSIIGTGIDSIQFDHTIGAITNAVRIKVPYDHELYVKNTGHPVRTFDPDLTKAIQLSNIPLTELTTNAGNNLDTIFYFADPIDSFQFALRRDSHGGPPVISGGLIDSNITIIDGFDFGDAGDVLSVPYTPPRVLSPNLNVLGDLFVGGDGTNLRVDSQGVTFSGDLAFTSTAGNKNFRFDSQGITVGGAFTLGGSAITIGGLSFDSHVIRPGNLVIPTMIDFLDTDYVQARVSNDAFWQAHPDALYYKPSGSVKSLLGGLQPSELTPTLLADHTLALSVRNIGKAPILIEDANDYLDDNAGNSPISIRNSLGQVRQWPTEDYLASIIDNAYVSSRVVLNAATLASFIDEAYIKSIVDSSYILSAANDSSEWQRRDNTLFFGTYPNVRNVNVGIGTDQPVTKFHVAGVGRFDSGLTVTGGPVNISGTQVTVDSDYFFQITSSLLSNNLNTLSQGALIAALNVNTDSEFEAFYFPTPPEQRFVEVYRIDSLGDSQVLSSSDYFFANPNSFRVYEDAVDSADLSLNVNLRTLPTTITFTGLDINGDNLNINTVYSAGGLLDSLQNPKSGYGGTFSIIDANTVSFTDDATSVALNDIFRIDDKSPKVTTSLSLLGPATFNGNVTVNNGYHTTVDTLTANNLISSSTSFTGPVSVNATVGSFTFDSNVTMYYGPGGLSFDSNIERIVDSNYIGNRLQSVWSYNNDAVGNQQIYYDAGGAVVIGEPQDMVLGDSDTKFFVKSGNAIFYHGDWDSAGVAITTPNVIPDFTINPRYGTNAGARMMWIPQRGAFRVGAVDGTTVTWDDTEVGRASVGIGYNTLATDYSLALGYDVKAGNAILPRTNAVAIGNTIDNPSQDGVGIGANIYHNQNFAGSVSIGENIVNNNFANAVAIGKSITSNSGVSIGKDVSSTTTTASVSIGLDQRASNSGVSIGRLSPSNLSGVSIGRSATSYSSTSIGTVASSSNGGVAIGTSLTANTSGVSIGVSNTSSNSGKSIGSSVSSNLSGVSIGTTSDATQSGTSIGRSNSTNWGGVAIGSGNTAAAYGGGVAIGASNNAGPRSILIGGSNNGNGYYGGLVIVGDNNRSNNYNGLFVGRNNSGHNGYWAGVSVFGWGNTNNSPSNAVNTRGTVRIYGNSNSNNSGVNIFGHLNTNNGQVNIYGSGNTGSTGPSGTSYIFGTNNIITRNGFLFGYGNTSVDNGYAYGVGNTVANGGYAYGGGNTTTLGTGYAFGYSNTTDGSTGTDDPMAFGHNISASSGGLGFGENLTVSNGGLAFGANSISSAFRSIAIGSGITVNGNNSVGIGLSSSVSGTVNEPNTLSIMGGKVAIGQAAADPAYDVDIYGNVHVGVFGDYWRHGKRISQYITDDVVNNAYVEGIIDAPYVQNIVDIPYLRATMTHPFFFYSDPISNDLYTTISGGIGIGRQPINSSKYKLDVDGSINYTGKLYLNGDLLIPSEDSLGDVYIEHHENQYFIGPDSAEEYFDSAYVTARQQMFGFTAGQTYLTVIDEGYINSRLDDTLFLDSAEAQVMIDRALGDGVAFGFDIIGRSSLTATPAGGTPSVGIGVTADIPGFGNMLKVGGTTEIQGNLNISNNGQLQFNGVPFSPTTVFTEDFAYIYYNGSKNVGIGTTVPAVDFDVNGTFNATEIQLNGADILGIFDSDFVRDRQILIDSNLTTQLINTDYIRAAADSDYIKTAITPDFLKNIVDSDYVKSIADSDYIKLVADSDYIKTAANQSWIRFNADSDYIKTAADSDYIKTAANRSWIRFNADSDYIKTAANQSWIRFNADSDYIKTAANRSWIRFNADSDYIKSVADSAYIKNIVDSSYTQLLTGIGIRDVDFGPHKILYRNSYSNISSLPTASSHKGMFAVINTDNKPYVSTGSAWNRIILNGDSVEFSDLVVSGNLTVNGTQTILNTQTLGIDDPMIHLGKNNELSDAVDIGFIGHYSPDGGTTKEHTGFFRDATNSEYYIFNGLDDAALDDSDPTATINRNGTGFTLAALNVGSISGKYLGFDSDFNSKTTDDLTEGLTNLYYTTVRANADFDLRLATKTTDDLLEGSNLYYTDDRVSTLVDSAYVLARSPQFDYISIIDSAYVQARVVPQGVDSDAVEAMVDSAYILARSPQFDYINIIDSAYINARISTVDSAQVLAIIDSSYITSIIDSDYILSITGSGGGSGSGSGGGSLVGYSFVAIAGQTVFSGSDIEGGILSYDVTTATIVTANGITLTKGVDYTHTDSSSLTFFEARDSGDEISIFTTKAAADAGSSGSTGTTTTSVTASTATIFDRTIHSNNFKSIEYTVHMEDSSLGHTQITKLLATYNKSQVFSTQYGTVSTFANDSDLGIIDVVENGGQIQLKLIKASGTGTVKVVSNKTVVN